MSTDATAPAPRVHTLRFPALGREIACRDDETVLAAARRAGLRFLGACGGRGVCGSCKVRLHACANEGRTDAPWQRACDTRPRSDLTVEVSPRSLAQVVRTDVGHCVVDAQVEFDPAIAQVVVEVERASIGDASSDAMRLRQALAAHDAALGSARIDAGAVAQLPALLRSHPGAVAVRLVHPVDAPPRVVGVARPQAALLGLAVDLGTTNVAGFLVDLASGHRLASLGIENPQASWGADLIARLNHAIRSPDEALDLQRGAVAAIESLARDLAHAVQAEPGEIVEVVVCGNTAMQHLLAGWPVAQLGRSPFVAASNDATELMARDLGLAIDPAARVHLAPGVGGFVGGDHVAALLATEPAWNGGGTALVIDIGTNTEVSLVHRGKVWSASCPSGPALEGGHIACGMRAARGAIERVSADARGQPVVTVIGGGSAVGLCGSGVIDVVAVGRRAGWVDARGRISADGAPTRDTDGARAIVLAPPRRHAPAVWFSQDDVRAVQLAKAAIRTGVMLLCAEAGIDESEIDRFVIAGAFGAYLDLVSATVIGLLPPQAASRSVQVGNAAGLGVQQMLASRRRRDRATQIAAACHHVELSSRGDFQKTFLRQIGL